MDDARFDEMARGFDTRLTRRRAGGLAAGALLALGLAAESDAKKRKRRAVQAARAVAVAVAA